MGFVIHWHESAMELHVFPIPMPPPTSLSTRYLWVFPVHQARALVSCIPPGLVICKSTFILSWRILAFLIFCPIFYINQMKCNNSVIFEKSLVWISVYSVKPEQDNLSCDKIIRKLSYDTINFSIMRAVLGQCFKYIHCAWFCFRKKTMMYHFHLRIYCYFLSYILNSNHSSKARASFLQIFEVS